MANSLNMELSGEYVVMDKKHYTGSDIERVFFCEDGFGCNPKTIGKAIFGNFVLNGEKCRVEGCFVKRLATGYEIKEAIKNMKQE